MNVYELNIPCLRAAAALRLFPPQLEQTTEGPVAARRVVDGVGIVHKLVNVPRQIKRKPGSLTRAPICHRSWLQPTTTLLAVAVARPTRRNDLPRMGSPAVREAAPRTCQPRVDLGKDCCRYHHY